MGLTVVLKSFEISANRKQDPWPMAHSLEQKVETDLSINHYLIDVLLIFNPSKTAANMMISTH